MAHTREQTETMSQGVHATSLLMEFWCAYWNQTETGSSGEQGRLVAGSWRCLNTKERDAPALEVRAGMPAVGYTSRDAAGLNSTNRKSVKVARTLVGNGPKSLCSVTEA